MGSSPVTATTAPSTDARRRLAAAVEGELRAAGVATGEAIVAAFSGGPDSTALLLATAAMAPRIGVRVVAAHVDHGLDPGSGGRAQAAREIARRVGVEFRLVSCTGLGQTLPPRPDGPEARARAVRYRLLDEARREIGASFVLTAHHADDQAETVLLRLLHGSGIAGLAGMEARRGSILRPLLRFGRVDLAAAVEAAGIQAVVDPTNLDLRVPRNRLRHVVLPALGPSAGAAAVAVARVAGAVRSGLEARLLHQFPELDDPEPSLRLRDLRTVPHEIASWALALLHQRSGLPYPPRSRAVAELARRLLAQPGGENLACDAGGGARWRLDGGFVRVDRGTSRQPEPLTPFSYTVAVPGGVEIREAGTIVRLTRQPVAPWMWQGSADRAALDLPLAASGSVTIRNRRPGDRLQPLGCPHRRRLKDVLIDRKVPRQRRDRLPLLCLDDQVAWVPGVTIHEPFRLRAGAASAWVAELLPASP